MAFIYWLVIKAYGIAIFIFSFFNDKAKSWIVGRKNLLNHIEKTLAGDKEKKIWFHCSSLGEYEQGKPVIEAVKKEYATYKIVLTFFSPSGYEIKKNDSLADYVFYMPLDGPLNSKKFIATVKPSMAFFVKNDFWHFYIKELKVHKIPVYYLAANFREGQIFFKWYGKFFDKMLRRVSHFFVQNQKSLELLYKNSIPQVTVSGDTRFDRVYQNSLSVKSFPEIEKFCAGKKIFIAGSSWAEDEKVITEFINNNNTNFKYIIAPHEIKNDRIEALIKNISPKSIRYSDLVTENATNAQVLIIDNVGMLSAVYRYADFAYIGGAFGKGLHNILEAVVFGKPVFFGPTYADFPEAVELVKNKTAFSITTASELKLKIDELIANHASLEKIKILDKNYIEANKGATDIVMNFLKINFI